MAKDNNTNLLRTEIWKELRELDDLVQNVTVTLPTGETFTYREECARWEGQCFVNDILNLDKIIGEVMIILPAKLCDGNRVLLVQLTDYDTTLFISADGQTSPRLNWCQPVNRTHICTYTTS